MPLSEQDILQTRMNQRHRISAAAWMMVRDAHAAEDIFQNVALKALTKDVSFESEGAVLSWAFVTARREGLDWLRRHRRESLRLDSDIVELMEAEWLAEAVNAGGGRMDADQAARVSELLRRDPDARAFLRTLAEQAVGVSELARTKAARLGAMESRVTVSSARGSQFAGWRWIAAAAAAVMLMIGGVFWWTKETQEEVRITDANGALQWTGAGKVIRDLAIGSIVSGGALESLSIESTITFAFSDGMRVTLSGQSAVSISAQRQKVLDVRSGSFSADVASQPEGAPMLVRTPAAERLRPTCRCWGRS